MIITISFITGFVLVAILKILENLEKELQKKEHSKVTTLISFLEKNNVHSNVDLSSSFSKKRTSCKRKFARLKIPIHKLLIIVAMIIPIADIFYLKWLTDNRYQAAVSEMSSGDYHEAITSFEELGSYKDSRIQIETAQNWLDYQLAQNLLDEGKFKEAAETFEELGSFEDSEYWVKEAMYQYAIEQYELENYEEATLIFQTLGGYSQSELYVAEIALILYESRQFIVYEEACKLYNMELYTSALLEFEKLGDYLDSVDLAQDCRDKLKRQKLATTISAGIRYSVGVKNDKTVITTSYNNEGQGNVSGWNNIVSISAKGAITIGLKSDGTVVVSHELSNIDVSDWKDIVAVSAGERYVVGLKNDGTVVSEGHDKGDGQRDIDNWVGITAIATGWRHTVGLDENGEIWITGYGSSSQLQQIENDKDMWINIIAIAAGGGNGNGSGHTVGLRADGTVVAVGDNSYGQCNVTGEKWRNIIAIAAGDWHTVGLRADGTVVSTKPDSASFYLGACDVDDWKDIVEISAGCGTTIGLKADGTTVAMGYNDYNQSTEANGWKDIMVE